MLQNDVILITGGGSGIGKALALQLAEKNTVIICGRREDALREVASKNANISYEVTDLSDYHSIDALFLSLKERGVVVNVLFNNAGVAEVWDLNNQELTSKEIFEKANTNFSGAVAMTQQFIRQANKECQNLIVNNTSEIAIIPIPLMPLYSASKSALSAFTRSLRVQLKNTNFHIVELLPPGVDTEMSKQLNNRSKMLRPEDFAHHALRKIMQGKLEYAPGPNVVLFKVLQKIFPRAGLQLIDKESRKQLGVK
jgi:uncharacterized oxidoreductase